MVKEQVDEERFDSIQLEGIEIYFDKRFHKKKEKYKIDYSPTLDNITVQEIWKR